MGRIPKLSYQPKEERVRVRRRRVDKTTKKMDDDVFIPWTAQPFIMKFYSYVVRGTEKKTLVTLYSRKTILLLIQQKKLGKLPKQIEKFVSVIYF